MTASTPECLAGPCVERQSLYGARQTIRRNVRFGSKHAPWRMLVLSTSRILVPRPWERTIRKELNPNIRFVSVADVATHN